MKYAFVPVWSGDKPVAYIGPVQNLKPETCKHLSPIDKKKHCNASVRAAIVAASGYVCTLPPTATLTTL